MASDADMGDDCGRLLDGLAELSLAMARDLQAAVAAKPDPADMVRLAGAFAKVGRCLRLTVALKVRIARGEVLAAPTRARGDERLDAERASETDPSEAERAERPDYEGPDRENLDHESLYERLPTGDPVVIARGLALDLIHAARALGAPTGGDVRPIRLSRDYATLCRELVANDPEPPDNPPLAAVARAPP